MPTLSNTLREIIEAQRQSIEADPWTSLLTLADAIDRIIADE